MSASAVHGRCRRQVSTSISAGRRHVAGLRAAAEYRVHATKTVVAGVRRGSVAPRLPARASSALMPSVQVVCSISKYSGWYSGDHHRGLHGFITCHALDCAAHHLAHQQEACRDFMQVPVWIWEPCHLLFSGAVAGRRAPAHRCQNAAPPCACHAAAPAALRASSASRVSTGGLRAPLWLGSRSRAGRWRAKRRAAGAASENRISSGVSPRCAWQCRRRRFQVGRAVEHLAEQVAACSRVAWPGAAAISLVYC